MINSFLIYVGFIQEPLTALLYNRPAVILTLIYVWIPFLFASHLHPCNASIANLLSCSRPWRPSLSSIYASPLPLSAQAFWQRFHGVHPHHRGICHPVARGGGNRGFFMAISSRIFSQRLQTGTLQLQLSMIMLARYTDFGSTGCPSHRLEKLFE